MKKNEKEQIGTPQTCCMATSGAVTSSPRFARFTVLGASRCTAVFEFLCALCAVAEGADVRTIDAGAVSCVPAVLSDAARRLSVFGGRAGMLRSLGSVLGCLITRFLRGSPIKESHRIKMPGVLSISNGIAATREGAVLVSDYMNHCLVAVEGSRERVIGTHGTGPLEFIYPRQVWAASDDFVFVADAGNRRVQVLSPCLGFHGFVGDSEHLVYPVGVCADDHAVFVSDESAARISVFNRADGAFLRCFGSLNTPQGLCFVGNNSRIAVAEYGNSRISVFHVDGTFDRFLGGGVLCWPHSIACTAFDEFVVADSGSRCVFVFNSLGELRNKVGTYSFTGVLVHRGAIFAQSIHASECVVYT
jgi:hypothetical protein